MRNMTSKTLNDITTLAVVAADCTKIFIVDMAPNDAS